MLGSWAGRAGVVVVLAGSLLAAGCGDDDDGGGGCPTCGPYGDVLGSLCDWMERCPDGLPYPIAYQSRDQCIAILAWSFTCRLEDHEINNVHHYEVVQTLPPVDAAQAAQCAAWIDAATCDLLTSGQGSEANPCSGLLFPDDGGSDPPSGAGANESCEQDQCRSGLYCESGEYLEATFERSCNVCLVLPAAGEPCGNGYACADGHYCKYDATTEMSLCYVLEDEGTVCDYGGACRSGFCNPIRMVCDSGGEDGDPCLAKEDCRYGHYCDLAGGLCHALVVNGSSCADDSQCANGDCDVGTSVCGRPDGTGCNQGSQCANNRCSPNQVCEPGLPLGTSCSIGEECDSGYCPNGTCKVQCYESTQCGASEFCDWQSSTCVPRLGDGSSCDDDDNCTSEHCNFNDVCGPEVQVGDACTDSQECYPLGYCAGGSCAARKAPGAACASYDECQEPFLCQDGNCRIINLTCAPAHTGQMCAFFRVCDDQSYCDLFGGITCVPRKPVGAVCNSTEECAIISWCKPGDSGSTCVARGAEGAPCLSTDECLGELQCGGSSTCESGPPPVTCDYDHPCADQATYCDDDAELCLPRPGVGQDCDQYSRPCQPELRCGDQYTCETRLAVGEGCDDNPDCVDTAFCYRSDYTCHADRQQGESCAESYYNVECAAGLYCATGELCQPTTPAGQPCDSSAQCDSGACFNAVCLASAECVLPQ